MAHVILELEVWITLYHRENNHSSPSLRGSLQFSITRQVEELALAGKRPKAVEIKKITLPPPAGTSRGQRNENIVNRATQLPEFRPFTNLYR
ncbi:MAG: hypothetical protein VX431_04085 [Planctomycetota bacterium]|nr:hypothetical protein [Planctomycetota bacterium]